MVNKALTLLFVILCGTAAYAATPDEVLLEEGVGFVNNSYDSEKAAEKFRMVIVSDTAANDLKAEAFLWLAHTCLFEGQEEKARNSVKELVRMFGGAGAVNLRDLPESLKGNDKLMYILEEEEKSLNGRAKEGEKTEIKPSAAKKEAAASNKTAKEGKKTAKYLLGAVFIIGYCVIVF